MEIHVNKTEEQKALFNRIVWINDDLLRFLADFYNVEYEKDWNNKIKYEDRERVKKITESRFKMDDIKKIYSNEIPRKQNIWCDGFYGYYVQIQKLEDKTWDVVEKSNWDIIYTDVRKILQLKKNQRGKKCYAILKALLNKSNFREITYTYEEKKRHLINDAHKILDYDESVRPWYNNIDDLITVGLAFDTSSVHDRRIELPAELYPLAKKIIEEYESGVIW